nr:hypothetical protein [Tanacetum cinerariifolium]
FFIIAVQTPGSGISILLAVGIPSTGSGNLYYQWELSPGSGNALCILFPTHTGTVPKTLAQPPHVNLPLSYVAKSLFLIGRHKVHTDSQITQRNDEISLIPLMGKHKGIILNRHVAGIKRRSSNRGS